MKIRLSLYKMFQTTLILLFLGWSLIPGWVSAGNDNLISKGEQALAIGSMDLSL